VGAAPIPYPLFGLFARVEYLAGERPKGGRKPSMHEGSERSQRYCTKCGAQVSPGDAFCGSCGARLSSGTIVDDPPTREIPQPVSERLGGYTLPTLRFPDAGRDIMYGALLALACAGLLVAVI
jgi:zinc-ribbon domain